MEIEGVSWRLKRSAGKYIGDWRRMSGQSLFDGRMMGDDKKLVERSSSHQHQPAMSLPTCFVSTCFSLSYISCDTFGQHLHIHNPVLGYPQSEDIIRRVREGYGSNEEMFADLHTRDLIWAQAIASDHCLKRRDRQVIELLVKLLNRGIYDQQGKDTRDQ